MNKNKAIVIEWFDDVNPDSYVLIPFHYEVKILQATPIDDDRTEVVFYGPAENVDKLSEDLKGNLHMNKAIAIAHSGDDANEFPYPASLIQ